jgi:hypothetical protein
MHYSCQRRNPKRDRRGDSKLMSYLHEIRTGKSSSNNPLTPATWHLTLAAMSPRARPSIESNSKGKMAFQVDNLPPDMVASIVEAFVDLDPEVALTVKITFASSRTLFTHLNRN